MGKHAGSIAGRCGEVAANCAHSPSVYFLALATQAGFHRRCYGRAIRGVAWPIFGRGRFCAPLSGQLGTGLERRTTTWPFGAALLG